MGAGGGGKEGREMGGGEASSGGWWEACAEAQMWQRQKQAGSLFLPLLPVGGDMRVELCGTGAGKGNLPALPQFSAESGTP